MTAPATRVFIVRHGATVLSAEDRFAGVTDVELSEEGREQARRLAERLSDEKIAAVYASPLGRTVETARTSREDPFTTSSPIDVAFNRASERAG